MFGRNDHSTNIVMDIYGNASTYYLATELADIFKALPVATGGELIISRPVFTRLVLITAHAKNIDTNRHMMANRPVYLGLWRGAFSCELYACIIRHSLGSSVDFFNNLWFVH